MKRDREPPTARGGEQVDLVEWYFEQGWTDRLPVVPPTPETVAAMVALCSTYFNLNGIQTTTHMATPLLVVNGPVRAAIGMNAGANVFGSGNRANATIGRAIRLVLLNVGGAWPGDLDKSTLGHPAKYTFCIAENEEASPWVPYQVEQGYRPEDSTVFCIATEGYTASPTTWRTTRKACSTASSRR